MARIHTDFIVLSADDYGLLLNLLPFYFECHTISDVPILHQDTLERKLHYEGKFILKKFYVE